MVEVLDQCRISPLGCCHGIGRSADARRPASVRPLAKAPAPTRVAPRAITLCAPTRAHRRSPDGTPAGANYTSLAQSPTQAQRSALPPPRSASMHGARTPRPRPGGPRADATTAPTRIAVHPLPHTPAAQTPRGHALCSLHHRDGAPGHTHRERIGLRAGARRCTTLLVYTQDDTLGVSLA